MLRTLYSKFRSVSRDTQDTFLRSAFWYRHASVASRHARSAAFVSLISALEGLLPEEAAAARCENCGQGVQRSISSRLIELLDTLAPGSGEIAVDRRKLYGIRSKLSHGSTLLSSDEHEFRSYLHPERTREWQESAFAYRITRIALVNWLLRQPDSQLGISTAT